MAKFKAPKAQPKQEKETIFCEGVRVFEPYENAPQFIKASVIITLNELVSFCKENSMYLTEYKGEKQLRLQLQESKSGSLYFAVDTFRPESQKSFVKEQEKAPF